MKRVWIRLSREAQYVWIAAIALVFVQTVIWMRTGLYPAASTADDAWFSEGGYYLLNEGVIRRPWLDDDLGGAIKDFFPPVTTIIQAGFFAFLGINAFSEMAQSSFACTIMSLLVVLLARRNGVSLAMALAAGMGIFGLQIVLEQSIRVRPEQWMVVFLLLSLLLQDFAATTKGLRRLFLALGAGLSLGVSCISYYPQAPLALVAGFVGLPLGNPEGRKRFLATFLGGSIILALFILYVTPDWDLFFAQELGTGSYYFTWEHVIAPLSNLFRVPEHGAWQGAGRFFMMAWEAAGVFVISVLLMKFAPRGPARGHALRAIIMALFYSLMGMPVTLVPAGVLFILALAAATKDSVNQRARLPTLASGAVVLAAVLGVAKISWIGTVAFLQREGRDYAAVTAQLDRLVAEPGRVAGERAAWLALRPRLGRDDLHWMVQSEYFEDFIFRSLILRGPKAGEAIKYLVIDRGRSLESIARDYPGFQEDIEADRFREIGHVDLPFRSMPFARTPPYDLVVYKRFD